MKRIPLLLLALAALLPAAASAQTRYTTQAVRLRAEPSPSAEIIGNIPTGAAVQVRGCQHGGGEWCAVEYARVSGYARSRYLTDGTGANDTSASPRGAAGGGASSSTSPSRSTRRSSTSRGRRSSSASRQYIRGPRGGCYYINSSGRKQYVDHSYCN